MQEDKLHVSSVSDGKEVRERREECEPGGPEWRRPNSRGETTRSDPPPEVLQGFLISHLSPWREKRLTVFGLYLLVSSCLKELTGNTGLSVVVEGQTSEQRASRCPLCITPVSK